MASDTSSAISILAAGAGMATLWRDGAAINMTPDVPAGQGSSAKAINDNGQAIVQISYRAASCGKTVCGHRLEISAAVRQLSQDINNAGQIVGSPTHAVTRLGRCSMHFCGRTAP